MLAFLALQFFRLARPGQAWRAQYSRHVVRMPFTDVVFSSGLKPALMSAGQKHPGSCAHSRGTGSAGDSSSCSSWRPVYAAA